MWKLENYELHCTADMISQGSGSLNLSMDTMARNYSIKNFPLKKRLWIWEGVRETWEGNEAGKERNDVIIF